MNPEGRITALNRSPEWLYCTAAEQALGQPYIQVFRPWSSQPTLRLFLITMENYRAHENSP